MELPNRGPENSAPNQAPSTSNAHRPMGNMGGSKKHVTNWSKTMWFRAAQGVLTLCVLVVVVGLLVFLAVSDNSNASEGSYVQTNRLQAVFLNTGQVYFGDIKSLNTNYLVLSNIFYLQSNSSNSSASSSSSSNNVTLVKLGCELHAPLDQMVINRSSVTFWENLSANGQVAKAVVTWQKENPNGQKCSDQNTAGVSGQSSPQSANNGTSK